MPLEAAAEPTSAMLSALHRAGWMDMRMLFQRGEFRMPAPTRTARRRSLY